VALPLVDCLCPPLVGVGLHFVSLGRWKGSSGPTYTLAWRLEGPVVGEEMLKGYPVRARGIGEFMAGPWRPWGARAMLKEV